MLEAHACLPNFKVAAQRSLPTHLLPQVLILLCLSAEVPREHGLVLAQRLPVTNPSLLCSVQVEVPVEHGLLLENLLDLAHAPFTHTSTFAKGWPVPDFVRFNAGKLLGGNWEPYPIDMSFEPPCCVLSTIGLVRQPAMIHVCRATLVSCFDQPVSWSPCTTQHCNTGL